jgi:hypothetical protein
VFIGVLRKKLKHTVIQKYFFLEILINVKAGRVYHGRRVGQACHIRTVTNKTTEHVLPT